MNWPSEVMYMTYYLLGLMVLILQVFSLIRASHFLLEIVTKIH